MLLLIQEGCSPHTHCLTDFWERLYSETSRRSRAKDRKNAQRSAAKSSIMICSLLDRQVKIINRLGGSIFSLWNSSQLSSGQKLRAVRKYLAGQGSTYSIESEYVVSVNDKLSAVQRLPGSHSLSIWPWSVFYLVTAAGISDTKESQIKKGYAGNQHSDFGIAFSYAQICVLPPFPLVYYLCTTCVLSGRIRKDLTGFSFWTILDFTLFLRTSQP